MFSSWQSKMRFLVYTVLFMVPGSAESTMDMEEVIENARLKSLQSYPRYVQDVSYPYTNIKGTPLSISNVDETAKTFAFTCLFECQWTDTRLKLNVTLEDRHKFGISYPSKDIKTPVIAITNSPLGKNFVNFDGDTLVADLDGHISVKKVVEVETICDIEMTYFPFDEQTCEVTFQGVVGKLNMSFSRNLPQSYNKIGGIEWEVLSVKTGEKDDQYQILFHLKRNSSFYLWSVIFPMVLLSTLNSFVFLLPSESGEKISFLVSLFVALAVFLNFINNTIPKSDKISRLSIYLILVQCHSTLCILATLFILNRHLKGKRGVSTEAIEDEATDKEVAISRPCNFVRSLSRNLFVLFFILSCLMPIIFGF